MLKTLNNLISGNRQNDGVFFKDGCNATTTAMMMMMHHDDDDDDDDDDDAS